MTIVVNGNSYSPPEALMYWIRERELIRIRKEAGRPKPWSDNPVFQTTYFCNVHRENDRVTKWIREYYSPYVQNDMFEYNIILSRFLNWPPTLAIVGYLDHHDPTALEEKLDYHAKKGKIWGGAYIITTHGIPMGKVAYLCRNVLSDAYGNLEGLRNTCRGAWGSPTCAHASKALQSVDGIGSFLAAQVVADLKNTKNHPLYESKDKSTFVEHGPGSLRGASWFHFGEPNKIGVLKFHEYFQEIRKYVDAHWPVGVSIVDNQDLQNCLCEYDKFMRVTTGTGRSKRGYNGV